MTALLLLILFGGVFALWVSNRDLKRRLDLLEERLDERDPVVRRAPTATPPAEATVPYTVGYTPPPEPIATAEPAPAEAVAPVSIEAVDAAVEQERERETLGGLFERLVAGRLLIWLGGIALVVAAVFLIRYSIEIGLVTPALRMIGAA